MTRRPDTNNPSYRRGKAGRCRWYRRYQRTGGAEAMIRHVIRRARGAADQYRLGAATLRACAPRRDHGHHSRDRPCVSAAAVVGSLTTRGAFTVDNVVGQLNMRIKRRKWPWQREQGKLKSQSSIQAAIILYDIKNYRPSNTHSYFNTMPIMKYYGGSTLYSTVAVQYRSYGRLSWYYLSCVIVMSVVMSVASTVPPIRID